MQWLHEHTSFTIFLFGKNKVRSMVSIPAAGLGSRPSACARTCGGLRQQRPPDILCGQPHKGAPAKCVWHLCPFDAPERVTDGNIGSGADNSCQTLNTVVMCTQGGVGGGFAEGCDGGAGGRPRVRLGTSPAGSLAHGDGAGVFPISLTSCLAYV